MSEQQITVRSIIQAPAYQQRFEEVLKGRSAQFIASLTSQCASGPLANVNPQSVIAAAFIAATLDLPVDRNLGFAWIVPYKGVAQFQVGYRGYIQLALRSAQYDRLNAFGVNAEALGPMDEYGERQIDFSQLRDFGPFIGYAVVFKTLSGFRKVVYWSKERVDLHARRYSQSFSKPSSPWVTNYDEMALKTVIANALKKWGPLSIGMQTAFSHDQGAQASIEGKVTFIDGRGDAMPVLDNGAPDHELPALAESQEAPAETDLDWNSDK